MEHVTELRIESFSSRNEMTVRCIKHQIKLRELKIKHRVNNLKNESGKTIAYQFVFNDSADNLASQFVL